MRGPSGSGWGRLRGAWLPDSTAPWLCDLEAADSPHLTQKMEMGMITEPALA